MTTLFSILDWAGFLYSISTAAMLLRNYPQGMNWKEEIAALSRGGTGRGFRYAAIAFAAILGLTGFGRNLFAGEPIAGPLLVLHLSVVPFFLFSMVGVILLRSGSRRKKLFILIVISAFVSVASVSLSMSLQYSSEVQASLFIVHRITAFLLLVLLTLDFFIFTTSTE